MTQTPGGEVLLVTSSYPRWAGDSTTPFIHHLAQDLRALGWEIRVIAPHAPGAARSENLDGVPVHRFRYLWPESLQTVCYDGGALVRLRSNPWLWPRVPFLVLAQWLAVLRRLAGRRVVLVHSHWLLPQGLTAGLAAALLRKPHLATVHGSDVFALRGFVAAACKRLALRLAQLVTVNSEATREAVMRLTGRQDKLLRIPMGASADSGGDAAGVARLRATYRMGSGPLLVFVGRLVPEKGVSDLLHCVAGLVDSLPGVTALVIGDGPDRVALHEEARRLGIASRVRFLGWLSPGQVRLHLLAGDMLVAPSRPGTDGTLEGQGLTLAEAMLADLPVIASSIGGFADAVRHEESGLLVNPGNPAEIAAAVRRITADPALAARLARQARALALREFTREVSALRFSEAYTRLVAGRSRAGSQSPAREKM